MTFPDDTHIGLTCKVCGGGDLYRVSKTSFQQFGNLFIGINNYACSDCQHKDYRVMSKCPKIGTVIFLVVLAFFSLPFTSFTTLSFSNFSKGISVPKKVPTPILDPPPKSVSSEKAQTVGKTVSNPMSLRQSTATGQSSPTDPKVQPNTIAETSASPELLQTNESQTAASSTFSLTRDTLPQQSISQVQTAAANNPTDEVVASNGQGGREKVLSLDPGHYTLQIATALTEKEATLVVQSLPSNNNSPPAFYYLSPEQESKWYLVLYGDFRSNKEANIAKNNLPNWIKQNDPFVRKISTIQRSMGSDTKK